MILDLWLALAVVVTIAFVALSESAVPIARHNPFTSGPVKTLKRNASAPCNALPVRCGFRVCRIFRGYTHLIPQSLITN